MAAGKTPKLIRSHKESICIPNAFSSGVRFMVEAILPSNASQRPASNKHTTENVVYPQQSAAAMPTKPKAKPIYVKITV